jgi:hypothetical protein
LSCCPCCRCCCCRPPLVLLLRVQQQPLPDRPPPIVIISPVPACSAPVPQLPIWLQVGPKGQRIANAKAVGGEGKCVHG